MNARQPARTPLTRDDFSFNSVLNAVDDLGMDPNGNNSVSGELASGYGSNTLIQFPPGEYLLTSNFIQAASASNFGIEGLGESHRDVVLRPSTALEHWFVTRPGDGSGSHMWRNFCFHHTGSSNVGISLRCTPSNGDVLFEDVEWLGVQPDDSTLTRSHVLATGASGRNNTVTLRRVIMGMHRPGTKARYPNGTGAIRIERAHSGRAYMEDCHIEEQGSSSFRLANSTGFLQVEGGFFKNNGLTQFRISGGSHPDEKSHIRDAVAVVDDVFANQGSAVFCANFDSSTRNHWGTEVINCDLFQSTMVPGTGRSMISVPGFGNEGSVTFRDCRIRNTEPGLRTFGAGNVPTNPNDITFENCHFTGSGGNITSDRGGSVIRNSCIDMPNASINGFSTSNISTSGCEVPDQTPAPPEPQCQNDAECDGRLVCVDGFCQIPAGLSPADLTHMLVVESADGNPVEYLLETTDVLLPASEPGQADTVGPFSASGFSTNIPDEYAFDGQLSTLDILQGSPSFTINGQQTTDPQDVIDIVAGGGNGGDNGGGTGNGGGGIPIEFIVGGAIAAGIVLRDRDDIY